MIADTKDGATTQQRIGLPKYQTESLYEKLVDSLDYLSDGTRKVLRGMGLLIVVLVLAAVLMS